MRPLKEIRADIKSQTDKESVKAMLELLGYAVDRDYKFKLRDENTSSTSIARNGYIKDFGSGWGGDIVALIHEHHNTSLKEATLWVANCLNIKVE